MQQVTVTIPKASMMETEVLKETLMGVVSSFATRPCSHDTLLSIESRLHEAFVSFFQDQGTPVDVVLSEAINRVALNKMLFYQFGMVSIEVPYLFHQIFSGLSSKEVPIVVGWQEEGEEGLY